MQTTPRPSNPRRKIFFSVMGSSILIGAIALSFYVEEKKFEAHYYQNELAKLQVTLATQPKTSTANATEVANNGYPLLLKQLASQTPNQTSLAVLNHSTAVSALDSQASKDIVATLKNYPPAQATNILREKYSLMPGEVNAMQNLLKH